MAFQAPTPVTAPAEVKDDPGARPAATQRPFPPRPARYDPTFVAEGPVPAPATLGPVTRLRTGIVHAWSGFGTGDNPRSFQLGQVKLTISSDADKPEDLEEADGLRITLRAPGIETAVLYPPDTRHSADFRVGRMDPKRAEPQVLVLAHSMNMRCCDDLYLASPHRGRWRFERVLTVDDEDPFEPGDRDGDGVPEIVTRDFAFLFAFCEYLCSFPPPIVYQIENGRAVDVSRRPAFRAIFEEALPDLTARCREGINAACASMVAVASRLGRRREAWEIMLARYDPKDNYGLPSWCGVDPGEGDCPADRLEKYEGFPDTLAAFLRREGYSGPPTGRRSKMTR
jgi:hypothetical protein